MIHVIGDIILDSYIIGTVDRISPEAPVPVLNIKETFDRLGGAGNVASVVADLGKDVHIWTTFADDDAGGRTGQLLEDKGIRVHQFKNTQTTTRKTRIISGSQQIVRIDEEQQCEALQHDQIDSLIAQVNTGDQVIVSDYGKGLIPAHSNMFENLGTIGAETLVDPKSHDFSKYKNCFLIKPNLNELRHATISTSSGNVEEGISKVFEVTAAHACLLTKSAAGMTLFESEKRHDLTAAAREVYDVTGAGDTVIAALAVARECGASLLEAAVFANYCAALAVTQLGCADIDTDKLSSMLDKDGSRNWIA